MLRSDVPDNGDLFEHGKLYPVRPGYRTSLVNSIGFDSLLSMRLRTALLSVVKKTVTRTQPLPRNVVYTCPSVDALTTYLLSRASGTFDTKGATKERIRCAITKYSKKNFILDTHGSQCVDDNIFALTSSTGSAGSSILALLLARTDKENSFIKSKEERTSGNSSSERIQGTGTQYNYAREEKKV